jgi:hypothetical protein
MQGGIGGGEMRWTASVEYNCPMSDNRTAIEEALAGNDPLALSSRATEEELNRMKMAEEVLQLAQNRKKNTSRLAIMSQVMVGAVAVAGMLVNGYQSYSSKKQQEKQAQIDQDRWAKEFQRSQRADKYRAFFETSVLATDPTNGDKRMVGYALLQEFVDDEDYNSKATLLLEEALVQELRSDTKPGLDEAHRNAVLAIVAALSSSGDCKALERAARSIDKIATRQAKERDTEETSSIFQIYVRKVVGRAATVCKSMREFSMVRHPLAETMLRIPEIVGVTGKLSSAQANEYIARMLTEQCKGEMGVTGVTDCPAIMSHYLVLCADASKDKTRKDEEAACSVIKGQGPAITH